MKRVRLRLAAYLALLLLPLGGGIWAFATFAAGSEQKKSDARLQAAITRGIDRYQSLLEQTALEAKLLATSPTVQRALALSDRRALAGLARADLDASFVPAHGSRVGRLPPRTAQRSIDVLVKGHRTGRVVVALPLGDALIRRLARGSGLPRSDLVVLAAGGRVVAPHSLRGRIELPGHGFATVRFGGAPYRARSTPLLRGRNETRLAVLEPQTATDAAAGALRRRVLAAGFTILLAVGLVGYAVAPGLSRGRFLRRQQAQAAGVLSHLGDGVFLVDRTGVVRLWNPAAERITGLRAENVEGLSADDAIPGWDATRELVPIVPVDNSSDAPSAATLLIGGHGAERWLSISGVAFAEGTVYAFRDLTGERKLEEARRDFVATVSHELRTPLASLYGAALTLRDRKDALDERMRDDLLAIVSDESAELARLVEQILLASQLDSIRLPMAAAGFDAAGLAEAVVAAARPRVSDDFSLELVTPAELPPALGDVERVRQVLSNLVDNAIKYSPDGGRIAVELERLDGRLRFTVRDSGLGIPASEQDRIFEKFYRLDPNMLGGVGGTGLGLYICRELVRQMNGLIWVVSEPGAGSAFCFELPAAPPAIRKPDPGPGLSEQGEPHRMSGVRAAS